jgi:3-(3-hydroxy-phenyl)propionate hydroxylase
LTLVLNMIPRVKSYFLQMRFKPMPRYAAGAVLHDKTGGRIVATSPVGRLFIQPDVRVASGDTMKLDDALGPWFAVVTWAVDPARHMSAATREFWMRLGARFVTVMPAVQMSADEAVKTSDTTLVLGDSGPLKEWFGGHKLAFVILRPDRFVAAAGNSPQLIDDVTRRLSDALHAGAPTDLRGHEVPAAA